jgi:hypothetical protein
MLDQSKRAAALGFVGLLLRWLLWASPLQPIAARSMQFSTPLTSASKRALPRMCCSQCPWNFVLSATGVLLFLSGSARGCVLGTVRPVAIHGWRKCGAPATRASFRAHFHERRGWHSTHIGILLLRHHFSGRLSCRRGCVPNRSECSSFEAYSGFRVFAQISNGAISV